jgi:hypothetical protein
MRGSGSIQNLRLVEVEGDGSVGRRMEPGGMDRRIFQTIADVDRWDGMRAYWEEPVHTPSTLI